MFCHESVPSASPPCSAYADIFMASTLSSRLLASKVCLLVLASAASSYHASSQQPFQRCWLPAVPMGLTTHVMVSLTVLASILSVLKTNRGKYNDWG